MRVGVYRHAPAALPPGRRPGTHCIGGWVGPRADLDGCGNCSPDRPAQDKQIQNNNMGAKYRARGGMCKCI